jgi:hypothetical protein
MKQVSHKLLLLVKFCEDPANHTCFEQSRSLNPEVMAHTFYDYHLNCCVTQILEKQRVES